MATPEEIRFAKNRFHLNDLLVECMFTLEACLGLEWKSIGGDLESYTGRLLENTIANQHLSHERVYLNGDKVGFIIGADPKWNPVVFVTTSHADPALFELDAQIEGYDRVRAAMVAALKSVQTRS
ncbi:MAG: hypothetical protein JSR82_06030 [Verrucomicrobia bacterium]|nr:hypothetical protein [Verrucomicrobiota bacterium]